MLSRSNNPTTMHSFLVAVEMEDGFTTPEQVALRLAEGLTWMEGIGHVDVDSLGKLEEYEDPLDV